ncbi:MAG: putative hydrolase [Clostridiales bacterium]|nr:putative hydrolase [Clostridiales bacterium]MDN5297642.1 putative hydrolase [Clostridiales bacterium]
MKPLIDLHTHTVASTHAYSTLNENIANAQAAGLRILGVSDHAPSLPNTTCPAYFANLRVLPRSYGELTLLRGVELNILSSHGDIDLSNDLLDTLDYAIASIHLPCYSQVNQAGNTEALIRAMDHQKVIMIGHPDDSRFPVDYEPLVLAAKEKGVLLEVNNSSLGPNAFRVGAYENVKVMLTLCKKYDVPVMMSSDAHYNMDIARFDYALAVIAETDFPEALIMNFDAEAFQQYLNARMQP